MTCNYVILSTVKRRWGMADAPKTVLVVDDEEKITRMLTRFLESLGYTVQARNCG